MFTLPKNATVGVTSVRNLVHERNVLRGAIDKIRALAQSAMGDWAGVYAPYPTDPVNLQGFADIIAACDAAVKEE